jgi:GNAT superfamily N-acetyltransferase
MNNHLPAAELIARPASFNDIETIQDIAAKTWPFAYEKLLGKKQVDYMLGLFYSKPALEEQMKNKHYFFLALKDFEPIGFASFSKVEASIYKLQKLYVVPDVQNTGAGKHLLNTVETVTKSMGAQRLQLNVNRKNPAKTFYEKQNFKILREEDINIGSGYFMNDYIMEKILN